MHISNIKIKNYRNLEYINISIGKLGVLIGENNSGKSNLLRAITLPFLNDDVGNINKTLAWEDINKKSRDKYFEFLIEHYDAISDGLMEVNEFSKKLPEVIVELELSPNPGEEYYVKNWIVKKSEEDKFTYKIRYVYKVKDVSALYDHVKNILPTEKSEINEIQRTFQTEAYEAPKKTYGKKNWTPPKPIATCPRCKEGSIVRRKGFYGCTHYKKGCRQTFPDEFAKRKLTQAMIRNLCERGKTDVIDGFTSQQGKTFQAALMLVQGKLQFDFSYNA